ncbi:transaldolase [Janthinobacterium sp. ROICE36]|uniref:transaldolase n=1 Tax=Janthinobacterium sp. ROICE36 TaxID=2048670 RepID=UPI000C7F0E6A|nr:transaldolase [Janthinobacterium sp. ROICE36]PLY39797.1 transaldolase [Janthinobacterium sp. ROICE36]
MNGAVDLHEMGQSLWLDNITRGLLDDGTLARYRRELAVTGLTSNPTIYQHALSGTAFYDAAIAAGSAAAQSSEALFFELALEDLRRAADLFLPDFDASNGADGWVSLEVSPLLANDTAATIRVAGALHAQAARPNLFIKIPGTPAGLPAIEESIFAGVPVNITLLFSCEQYQAAAEAYLRGVERRIEAGLDPAVGSVASLFISRWDVAVAGRVPAALRNTLGIAVARQTYRAYRELLASRRWRDLAEAGARPQHLLWASTGTKDPQAPDVMYLQALAAPNTINTIPEKTLLAFADHGVVSGSMPADGGDAEKALAAFGAAGIDLDALARQLQQEGADAFSKSWKALLELVDSKRAALRDGALTRTPEP